MFFDNKDKCLDIFLFGVMIYELLMGGCLLESSFILLKNGGLLFNYIGIMMILFSRYCGVILFEFDWLIL